MKLFQQKFVRQIFISALVVLILISMSVPAFARASDYLVSYGGSVYKSDSTVYVSFAVTGTSTMDDIGALSIMVYESSDGEHYSLKSTFRHEATSGMLAHNTGFKAGTISFAGSVNKTYKAYICVYAGKNNDGDSRWFWAYE